ncbi:putative phage repressor [Desulfuromonas acetoxidans DSM 684]|uniref:Phage repressor n=1 Tax=Desulfuromonas acetoxidans (strain DSM 684 / 11070) TaxID=281689 RepID=Q1JZ74_DESA6|nr:putative phage repressor [Desulfuromonas acetoxidans DSM 684]
MCGSRSDEFVWIEHLTTEVVLKTIGERLRFLRGKQKLPDFAQRFGVSKSTLGRYEKGISLPDAGFLAAICQQLHVCPQWLLMGGEKPCQPFVKDCPSGACDDSGPSCIVRDYANLSSFKTFMDFFQNWVVDQGFEVDKLLSVRVTGDSMAPTFAAGSLVLVDMNQPDLSADAIFALRQDEKVIVRRLQKMVNGDVHVKTDNPRYEDQIVRSESLPILDIVGRVVWAGVHL